VIVFILFFFPGFSFCSCVYQFFSVTVFILCHSIHYETVTEPTVRLCVSFEVLLVVLSTRVFCDMMRHYITEGLNPL